MNKLTSEYHRPSMSIGKSMAGGYVIRIDTKDGKMINRGLEALGNGLTSMKLTEEDVDFFCQAFEILRKQNEQTND